MTFTDEMITEDAKRWEKRDILAELGYCSRYMRDRLYITENDLRFYAYLMRRAKAEIEELRAAKENRRRLEVHNIGNVDIPEGVTWTQFQQIMEGVVDALEHTEKGESWPYVKQSDAVGMRVTVKWRDAEDGKSHLAEGEFIRDDVEEPFQAIIRLDNGSTISGTNYRKDLDSYD